VHRSYACCKIKISCYALNNGSTLDFKGKLMILTAVIVPAPEGGFTASNPETGTTTQGESMEEALANLREATLLYLEEFPSWR